MAARGTGVKAAFRLQGYKASAYTYPVALGAPVPVTLTSYDQLPFISEAVRQTTNFQTDNTLRDSSGFTKQIPLAHLCGGQLFCEARWSGLNQLIAAAFGMERFRLVSGSPNGEALEYPEFKEAGDGNTWLNKTATGGTTGTLVDVGETTTEDWVGDWIRLERKITGGGAGEEPTDLYDVRRITAVNTGTDTITVSPDFKNAPPNGCQYSIARRFHHVYEFSKNLHSELMTDVKSTAFDSDGALVRLGVLGIDKGESVWEWQACAVESLTITLQEGKLYIAAELIPFGYERRTADRNSDASEWDLSPASFAQTGQILLSDGTFRIDDYSDSVSLTSADNIGVNAFTVTIRNNLNRETIGTSTADTGADGPRIIEPKRRGLRSVTGSFTVPRHSSDTLIAHCESQTQLMAEYKFTSPKKMEGAAASTQVNIYLRALKLSQADAPVISATGLQQQFNFQCFQPAGDSSGMPAHWSPLEQSEMMIETYDSYPFNNFMGQHFTPS